MVGHLVFSLLGGGGGGGVPNQLGETEWGLGWGGCDDKNGGWGGVDVTTGNNNPSQSYHMCAIMCVSPCFVGIC